MLTFGELKTSDVVDIASCAPDSDKFASLVNSSVRRLMRRGDWDGTVAPIHVCVKSGCLVFPRYVDHVRKLNLCSRSLPVENLWYNFINRRDWRCGSWRGNLLGESGLMASGQSPAYSDVYGDGRQIRAYPRTPEDIGKSIRIFGVDNGNQPLVTHNQDGTWSDGIAIALADPYGTATSNGSSVLVRRIDRVLKDVTQGQVLFYAYNVADATLEDLARYDPGEISPSYTRYQLQTGSCSSGSCLKSVVALVKLKFIPVKFNSDLVLLDNIDAIKEMVQSVKLREAGELDDALKFELAAVRELNRDLEDASPDDQFACSNEVFGGRTFRNRSF